MKGICFMSFNINQTETPFQGQSEQIDRFIVFRIPHSLGQGVKKRIKSFGCIWSTLYHGWLCPFSYQKSVEEIFTKANVLAEQQSVSLPKGMIHLDSKIAGRQSRLEILEVKYQEDYKKLLQDIYRYNDLLRPEDFDQLPCEEGTSPERIRIERDFYERWRALQKLKADMEIAKQEIAHLSADSGGKIFDSEAPLLIADALIQECFVFNGQRTLQFCSSVFWEWDGIKYLELSQEGMRQIVYDFLRDAKKLDSSGNLEDFNPTKFRVDQVIDALRGVCFKNCCPANGSIWLDEREGPDPRYLISFRNGLLDMKNWLGDSKIGLIPHTPLLMNVNSLAFDFDPLAPEPQEWIQFLNALWPNDQESQQVLQEWIGYLLVQDTSQHKILLIIGPPRSGKGTIGRVLHDLIGAFNVVGPTLSSLGGEFGLQPLLNKMLATISDARLNSRGNNSLITERLLSISGEDPLTINRKFLPPLTVQLPTRLMMMSNELPDMQDASGALAGRYIVLILEKSWLGHEDTRLFDRLRLELPGILLWALKGLARLKKRGKFIQPASSFQIIEELQAMTSPIKAFVSERCEIKASGMVSIGTLFETWRGWCNDSGYLNSGNIQSFGKSLRAAFPGIGVTKPQENHVRTRYYRGISLIRDQNASADVRVHVEGESY